MLRATAKDLLQPGWDFYTCIFLHLHCVANEECFKYSTLLLGSRVCYRHLW